MWLSLSHRSLGEEFMRRAPPIELNAEELADLQRTTRSSRSSVREEFRARIVLLAAEGLRNRAIAEQLGTSADTVSKWRRRFAEQRFAGLVDRSGRGRKPHYGREVIERIVDDAIRRAHELVTHWSTRTMAKHAGVSHTTVQRIWHAHEFKPHLVRLFKLSNDKHFVEKLRDVVGLYLTPPPEHAQVFCVDEISHIQALDRPQPGLPMNKGRAGTMTHDYKRHGTTTLFAALNVLESTVIGKYYPRHRHTEFPRFLREIDRLTPKELDIHLIVGNYSTHKHRYVMRWFEGHSRFHAHFITASSSWLNLVERFFREITDRRIRRGIFRSVRELTQAIYDFLKCYNDNPRPFVCTQSADQILSKLAPLYANRGKSDSNAIHYTRRDEQRRVDAAVGRGMRMLEVDPVSWARKAVPLVGGEICVHPTGLGGARQGYEPETLRPVCAAIHDSAIAFGSVLIWKQLVDDAEGGADAVAPADLFRYAEQATRKALSRNASRGIPVWPGRQVPS